MLFDPLSCYCRSVLHNFNHLKFDFEFHAYFCSHTLLLSNGLFTQKSMQSLLDETDSDSDHDVASPEAPEEADMADIDEITAGEEEALEFYNMMRKRKRAGDDQDSAPGK